MNKNLAIPIALFVVGGIGAFFYLNMKSPDEGGGGEPIDPEFCVEHQIAEAECPWCEEGLIERMGECADHNVPKALCAACNPKLIEGFMFEGDWCATHATPQSQCAICLAEAAAKTPPPGR